MLETEMRNPKTTHIDKMTTREMIRVMNEENRIAVEAVAAAEKQIAAAVDTAAHTVATGGRIFYIGAGTSGRLGVVDAAECPPTFGVSPQTVNGIIAGGRESMFRASENVEDQKAQGRQDISAAKIAPGDFVMGISAAGGAAYVVGALEAARAAGCVTAALSCNPDTAILRAADYPICTRTGAEVITGSTRLKAGTAQKLVLNMISTFAMVKTGKVYENMMINLKPSNIKLRRRMIGILQEILHCDEQSAVSRLERANWSLRAAAEQRDQQNIPVSAQVQTIGGVPTMVVNGKPTAGCAYISYLTDRARYADFAAAGYRLYSFPAFFATRTINEKSGLPPLADGIFEDGIHPERFDAEVEKILAACPDAMILPRINTTLPRAWDRVHPEEMCDGKVGSEPCVCFSSDLWAEEVKRLTALLIGHVQNSPYAAHIVGYQLAGGQTEEWMPFDFAGSVGPRAREKFESYPDKSEAGWWRFLSETVASRIDEFAAYVKKLTQGRVLVGAFYGYTFELPGRKYAHHALQKITESPSVDFVCSPVSYRHRNDIAYDGANMTALDSVKLHGKLYFAENDTRTERSRPINDLPNYNLPVWCGPEHAVSEEILKMHFARALVHGHAFWWFDMWGGWYDGTAYRSLMKRFANIAEHSLTKDRRDVSPVAVFTDERAYDAIDDDRGRLCSTVRDVLGRMGVPYAVYLTSDFDAVQAKYPLMILIQPVETEDSQHIKDVRQKGLAVVTPAMPLEDTSLRSACIKAGIQPYLSCPAIVYENQSYLFVNSTEDAVLDVTGRGTVLKDCFGDGVGTVFSLRKGVSCLFEKEKAHE